jgi:hypothetical protein
MAFALTTSKMRNNSARGKEPELLRLIVGKINEPAVKNHDVPGAF